MGDVIDISSNDPHYKAFALCIQCSSRWIAIVHFKTSIFNLECPQCGEQDSFGSIIPEGHLDLYDDCKG